jgi:hypothetical protein
VLHLCRPHLPPRLDNPRNPSGRWNHLWQPAAYAWRVCWLLAVPMYRVALVGRIRGFRHMVCCRMMVRYYCTCLTVSHRPVATGSTSRYDTAMHCWPQLNTRKACSTKQMSHAQGTNTSKYFAQTYFAFYAVCVEYERPHLDDDLLDAIYSNGADLEHAEAQLHDRTSYLLDFLYVARSLLQISLCRVNAMVGFQAQAIILQQYRNTGLQECKGMTSLALQIV